MISAQIDDRYQIEIPTTFGKYQYIKKIGSGAFSVVILVENVKTKEKFACKVVSRELLIQENTFDRFEQELRLLQSFNHPNIVRIQDVCFEAKLIFLIMEYCSKGELFSYILQNGVLVEFQIKHFLKQIISALVYLHGRHVAHRDIKPENILLDTNLNLKLADFGLCHTTSNKQLLKTPCGSPFYAPPEIISNVRYDGEKGDMWSLGVVVFTMATGALPWTEFNQAKLSRQIINADYVVPLSVPPDIKSLIQQLMDANPNQRPSALEVSKLSWLSDDQSDKLTMRGSRRNARSMSFGEFFLSKNVSDVTQSSALISQPTLRKRKIIVRPGGNQKMLNSVELSPIVGLVRKVPQTSHLVAREKKGVSKA